MLFFREEKSVEASTLSNLVFLHLLQFCQLLDSFCEMLELTLLCHLVYLTDYLSSHIQES